MKKESMLLFVTLFMNPNLIKCLDSLWISLLDATINFNLPVRVLINASKNLVKGRKEKEVKNDLLFCVAPPSGLEPETL
jgi:hypothetical protein